MRDDGSLGPAVHPRILVPLMHACDHDLLCQLQNSALYQVLTRCVQMYGAHTRVWLCAHACVKRALFREVCAARPHCPSCCRRVQAGMSAR